MFQLFSLEIRKVVIALRMTDWQFYEPLQAFELGDVQLDQNTFQARAAASNLEYLLQLDPDRMLYAFRNNAGLQKPGLPFYGTWEDPYCELRGHFVGHYLTALSYAAVSTGNITVKSRLELYITELQKVQDALNEGGYLSAFPSEHFDRAEALKGVWAPYYVIHKIMAGLLDANVMTGNKLALTMVKKMAAYFLKRIDAVISAKGQEHWQRVLDIEFGGMNDVMYRLYSRTKDLDHLRMAKLFDKKNFYEPMVSNQDILAGHHANTHLAQVVGFVEKAEASGDPEAIAAVTNFFDMVSGSHAYATGGSNDKEFWFEPGHMAESVIMPDDSLETQEICTQYNVLKIARSMFRWSGDVKLADFYERALVNGILGVSRLTNDDVAAGGDHHHGHEHEGHHHHLEVPGLDHMELSSSWLPHHHFRSVEAVQGAGLPQDVQGKGRDQAATSPDDGNAQRTAVRRRAFAERSQDYWGFNIAKIPNTQNATNVAGTPGVFLYLLPMGSGQSKGDNYHHWGYPMHSFWCCYGTAIESFAKLADSIFFYSTPAAEQSSSSTETPVLYVNQLVSSRLNWRVMSVVVKMTADMFAPGPSATANLSISLTQGQETRFTLQLRIPQWTDGKKTILTVNGQEWRRCPSTPSPGSYCNILRSWKDGDRVEIGMGLTYWVKPLPENRPEYQSLKALMMGPYVMAGLTHDSRWLELDELFLSSTFSEPDDFEELVSLQASWNASLFLRHDMYHAHMSYVEDSGDAIDSTFRLLKGCHIEDSLKRAQGLLSGAGSDASNLHVNTAADHEHHQQHMMKVGLHEDNAVMFESMNFPGFYLGVQDDMEAQGGALYLTLTQPGVPGTGENLDALKQDFCRGHQFMMRKGLNGQATSLSLESVAFPGLFLTVPSPADTVAFTPGNSPSSAPACEDDRKLPCAHAAEQGLCISQPEVYKVKCPKSCSMCPLLKTTLRLQTVRSSSSSSMEAASRQQQDVDVQASAAADTNMRSSFKLVQPLTHRYPPGSKVVKGVNRKYLVAPLGNLLDERYTVYFNMKEPRAKPTVSTT
ncbi:hypothetical protein CEUSTIGMA_g3892.t1 [Chlamydomonas eustigma]|uniref:ShKT domain-containing protein n=1 Tax=Chlamydomonas eustigma TaxID=1157962 RepID=A0A250X051_9CHLO|nr:hypothetical protein CEUSTIGMA_g3892.t1 [Chlamydomonas eustigma]|eukprot:GAX76447.1 hypothetical protein CEUSTIGMA_g3892.t1 [Chlamydomonas eustigma]